MFALDVYEMMIIQNEIPFQQLKQFRTEVLSLRKQQMAIRPSDTIDVDNFNQMIQIYEEAMEAYIDKVFHDKKNGGTNMFFTTYQSPIGELIIESDGTSLTALYLEDECDIEISKEVNSPEIFNLVKAWLDAYFRQENPSLENLPLKPKGNDFKQTVWNLLLKIPHGKTITYKDLAMQVATKRGIKTMSAQAIGGAVGNNPISIIIPCHRVIGQNNNLTGYAGGLDKKIALLKLEGHDVNKFRLPKGVVL